MARWQPNGNNELTASSIQPRYRRLLSVGGVLDESIQLFRQHWTTLALFGLVGLVPSWLLLVITYAGGFQSSLLFAPSGGPSSLNGPVIVSIVVVFVLGVLSVLCALLWSAASTAAAAAFVSGVRPGLRAVYRVALRRFLALLGCGVLYTLASLGLMLGALILFAITLFGVLGTFISVIALLVWWRKPTARKPWLKWLIILTAPFGLLTYYTVRWALWLPAIVVEQFGPLGALKRSFQLTQSQWFRTFAVVSLSSIILSVLVTVPILLVDLLLGVSLIFVGNLTSQVIFQVVNGTISSICQVLFSSIVTITLVLLMVDLRNRREGTDLGERIGSLEVTPS